MNAIYIHIPFCKQKCAYCAFCSFAKSEDKMDEYIFHLTKEIENFNYNKAEGIDTIYIGGGTPSLLKTYQLKRIFDALYKKFKVKKDAEITIECNPNSLTLAKAKFYNKLGINRVSLGVQSLDKKNLKLIERLHTPSKALKAIDILKESGIENISVDLLIGLKEDFSSFASHLQQLIEKGVKHFSLYMLQIERGTKLEKLVKENCDLLLNDDSCVEFYQKAVEFLKKNRFLQYEISNFAIQGFESRHNIKYWTGSEYVGFGMSAHSYLDGKRYANSSNFKEYYQGKREFCEQLTLQEQIEELIMLGMRCFYGTSKKELQNLGYDIEKNANFLELVKQKIIKEKGDRFYLDPTFYGVSNDIIIKLLP